MINCLFCQRPIKEVLTLKQILAWQPIKHLPICDECRANFLRIEGKICQNCGRPLSQDQRSPCHDCLLWQEDYHWTPNNQALFSYDAAFKEWLLMLKGRGDFRLANLFSSNLKTFQKAYAPALWVPVPSSPKNYEGRGFHQTEVILKTSHIPYVMALDYKQESQKQALQGRYGRLHRKNPFILAPKTQLPLGRQVVLFDDVYTTGATMHSAWQTLEEADYQVVGSVTLAR